MSTPTIRSLHPASSEALPWSTPPRLRAVESPADLPATRNPAVTSDSRRELHEARAALESGETVASARQHDKGKLLVRERIDLLLVLNSVEDRS